MFLHLISLLITMLEIIFFITLVISIEFFIFYSPLYIIGYKFLKLDNKVGDQNLAIILSLIALFFSIIFFKQSAQLIINSF